MIYNLAERDAIFKGYFILYIYDYDQWSIELCECEILEKSNLKMSIELSALTFFRLRFEVSALTFSIIRNELKMLTKFISSQYSSVDWSHIIKNS